MFRQQIWSGYHYDGFGSTLAGLASVLIIGLAAHAGIKVNCIPVIGDDVPSLIHFSGGCLVFSPKDTCGCKRRWSSFAIVSTASFLRRCSKPVFAISATDGPDYIYRSVGGGSREKQLG